MTHGALPHTLGVCRAGANRESHWAGRRSRGVAGAGGGPPGLLRLPAPRAEPRRAGASVRAAPVHGPPRRGADDRPRLAGQAARPLPHRQPALRAVGSGARPPRAEGGGAAVPPGPVCRGAHDGAARGPGRHERPRRGEDHRPPADADAVPSRGHHPRTLLRAGPSDPRVVRRADLRRGRRGGSGATDARNDHQPPRAAAGAGRRARPWLGVRQGGGQRRRVLCGGPRLRSRRRGRRCRVGDRVDGSGPRGPHRARGADGGCGGEPRLLLTWLPRPDPSAKKQSQSPGH